MDGDSTAYLLSNFPLPPTDNHLYLILRGGKRVKSSASRNYSKECEAWGWANQKKLKELKEFVKLDGPLQVDILLRMERKNFYCADGRIKKMDASNRLKASMDELAKLLGVDDSQFFSLSITKIAVPANCLDIFIQSMPHQ